jgi:hypothetical protein
MSLKKLASSIATAGPCNTQSFFFFGRRLCFPKKGTKRGQLCASLCEMEMASTLRNPTRLDQLERYVLEHSARIMENLGISYFSEAYPP